VNPFHINTLRRFALPVALGLIGLHVLLVPLTLTEHLEFMNDGERDLLNARSMLATGDLTIPGAHLSRSGSWVGSEIDQGPLYSMLLAPALLITQSPLAVVATHGLITVAGLLALFLLARPRVGDVGALLAVVLMAASGETVVTMEKIWHPSMMPGLLLIQLALLDRVIRRPTTGTLSALMILTAVICQVYMAAAATVPAVLFVLGWVVLRKVLPRKGVWIAVAAGFLTSLPFLLRLLLADHGNILEESSEHGESHLELGRYLAGVARLINPDWTVLAGWMPTAWLVGAGVLLGIVGVVHRRDVGRIQLAIMALTTVALSARAFGILESQRYLLIVPFVLVVFALDGFGWLRERLKTPTLPVWVTPSVAVLCAALIWVPPVVGGWRMASLGAAPVFPSERIGADTRLGLGEQEAIVSWTSGELGWGWNDLYRCAHGNVCTQDHGLAVLTDLRPTVRACTDTHLLVVPDGTSLRVPDERVVARHGFDGAFGRRVHLIRFRPAVDLDTASALRVNADGSETPCALTMPLRTNPTRHGWPASLAAQSEPQVADTCTGEGENTRMKITIPVHDSSGTVQILVRPAPNDRPHPDAVRITAGQDEPYAVYKLSWAPPTKALTLRVPADDKIVVLDVY